MSERSQIVSISSLPPHIFNELFEKLLLEKLRLDGGRGVIFQVEKCLMRLANEADHAELFEEGMIYREDATRLRHNHLSH